MSMALNIMLNPWFLSCKIFLQRENTMHTAPLTLWFCHILFGLGNIVVRQCIFLTHSLCHSNPPLGIFFCLGFLASFALPNHSHCTASSTHPKLIHVPEAQLSYLLPSPAVLDQDVRLGSVWHGYGKTRGFEVTGLAGTGTVSDLAYPRITAYPCHGITGMYGYITG